MARKDTGSAKQPKADKRQRARALAKAQATADRIATKFLNETLDYSWLLDHADDELWELSRHIAETRLAHLPAADREAESENHMFYLIGLAVGRQLSRGGGR
jgi:hypothetical protein